MLSENAIDNLIQPIIERQENINSFVIETMAKKIQQIGTLSASDIIQLKTLIDYGADVRKLNSELARLSNLQVRDIKGLIKTVAINTHMDAKMLYDYRHKPFIPYEKNGKLKRFVTVVGNRTSEIYKNLSKSKATGFYIRDLRHPGKLKFQSIGDTYQSIIDEAVQSVVGGKIDYRKAMRRTIRQLAESGVRKLYWDSGYSQRMDTAVRRNLLEGIRSIQQLIEDENGKIIGADGKELSAHINCALDHEPFQGHRFTNAEFEKLQGNQDFEDIDGNKFAHVDRVIGEYNCRHIAYSIILGVSKPRYSKAHLQKMIQDNHDGYTTPDGQHLSLYECTQIQRRLETKIRHAKDEQMAFKKAGDRESAKISRLKVIRYVAEYKQFSHDCGLKISKDRITIPAYQSI